MSAFWAISLPQQELPAAEELRQRPHTEACLTADRMVWIRGQNVDDELTRCLKKIPAARRFQVLADGQLIPEGKRVPQGRLPSGHWISLTELMQVAWPSGLLGGALRAKIPWKLIRSKDEQPANLLLTTLPEWHAYAVVTAQVRLNCWTFALDANERILVRGQPLPSLAGSRFWEADGIAVPVGFTWTPHVPPAVLRQAWKLQPDDLALVNEEGTWECIRAEFFVKASRSAIRLSAAGVTDAI